MIFQLKEEWSFRSFTWTCTCNSGPLMENDRADQSLGVVFYCEDTTNKNPLDQIAVLCPASCANSSLVSVNDLACEVFDEASYAKWKHFEK